MARVLLPDARPIPQGTGIKDTLFNIKDPPMFTFDAGLHHL